MPAPAIATDSDPVLPTIPSSAPPLPGAWLVVALLIPVALLNYLDRQMLAAMKPSLTADLTDIQSQAHWGLVLGSFKWVYALLSPIGGYLADRLNRKRLILFSLCAWSAVTCWTGCVRSYEELLWARGLMGLSEACYIPAALALIADFHLGATRSRAVGLHQTGIYAGLILGGFSGYAAESPWLGWRWTFALAGAVGLLYSLPLSWLLRDPPQKHLDRPSPFGGSESRSSSPQQAAVQLLGNRDFLLLVLYFTLPALAGWVVRDWMPDILRERFRLGEGRAGVTAVLYVQLASLVGAAVGGTLADRWMTWNPRGRIYTSALGMSLFLPSLFGVGHAASVTAAICFLLLFGLGWGCFDSNNMPILCQIVRPELRATGYGVMNLVSISCGGLADWWFGLLRDRDVPLDLIFGTFAGIALLSIGIVLLIRPRQTEPPLSL